MREIDLQKEDYTEKERRNIDILEIVRKLGPISRPDISKEMGINVVTISNYIDEFIKRNVVYEKELDVSDGGRRPVLLDLNPRAGFVVGVGLNLMNMVGLLVDLKGNIVIKTQISRHNASVSEISDCLLEIVREILRRSKDYTSDIIGVGVGIAGLINKASGTIHWPQRVGGYCTYESVDLPLRELMEKEFDLPALIENDATSASFGEHWHNLDSSVKNVLYMFSGVGCGIMINGEVYRGAQGYAGELSVYNHKEDSLFNCEAGNPCFLKRWDIDLGITSDMKAALAKDQIKARDFYSLTSVTADTLDLKSIFMAARADDALARAVLKKAATRMGIRIAYLVNLLNPQAVIIGGGFEEAGEEFLKDVISTVKEWAFGQSADSVKIIYSQLRENAVALGAASLVMQKAFGRLW
jgi:predicted NBD/HSP70 family sugar kinase